MSSSIMCVHCGTPLLQPDSSTPLTTSYDVSTWQKSKLLYCYMCPRCNVNCDPLSQRELFLVLLDFCLQSLPAHIHVLFNERVKNIGLPALRVALLALICDGYALWFYSNRDGRLGFGPGINQRHFEQEWNFYLACFHVSFGLLCYVASGVLLSSLLDWTKLRVRLRPLFLGLLLSYAIRILSLASIAWEQGVTKNNDRSDVVGEASSSLMASFVNLLSFATTVTAFRASLQWHWVRSFAVSFVVHAVRFVVVNAPAFLSDPSCVS